MEPQTPLFLLPEHKNNRKFIIIVVSLFVLIMVAIGFVVFNNPCFEEDYLGYELGPKCASSLKPSNIDVSNEINIWKIYRNNEYGFELQMPSDWVVGEVGVQGGRISFTSKERYDFWHKGDIGMDGVSVDMIFDDKTSSKYDDIISTSTTVINGIDFNVYGMSGMYGYDVYRTSNAGRMFSFSIMTDEAYKVLSTFKFIPTKLSASVYTKPFQKGEYDYFGTLNANGYIEIIDEVCDPKMEGDIPCSQLTNYKSAVFHVTGSDSSLFMSWLGDTYDNSLVGPDKITLGCYDGNKEIISYINSGDDGVVKSEINGLDLSSILSSTKSSPVKVQMVKSYNTAGKGAPLCYSVFRNFKVIK